MRTINQSSQCGQGALEADVHVERSLHEDHRPVRLGDQQPGRLGIGRSNVQSECKTASFKNTFKFTLKFKSDLILNEVLEFDKREAVRHRVHLARLEAQHVHARSLGESLLCRPRQRQHHLTAHQIYCN